MKYDNRSGCGGAGLWRIVLRRVGGNGLILLLVVGAVHARGAARWEEMDYGPFLTSSVTMHPLRNPESVAGVTVKGITVRLDKGKAAVCFDTNLCRYAGGWYGGWLELMGTPFDGTHRPPEKSRPAVKGTMIFESGTSTPGWGGKDGGFVDPREEPYLPLPRDWAHYEGLYVDGEHVTFRYSVGGCEVLDSPWFDDGGTFKGAFTRTLKIAPNSREMVLLVAESPRAKGGVGKSGGMELNQASGGVEGNVAVLGDVAAGGVGLKDGSWQIDRSRLVLKIPAHENALMFKVLLGAAEPGETQKTPFQTANSVVDVSQYAHGGKARFAKTVETHGTPGAGTGAYVVDTLTLPEENPWKSWMRIGGFDFFADGKSAAVCTWSGDVWIVTGIDAGLEHLTWKRFASGLFQPLGLKVVEGKVYVLGRDQITILHDLNGDGEADFYENFNNDISVTPNFHEFVFDLQQAPDGSFFFTKGAPLLGTDYFDPIGKHNGCVLHVSKDGKALEVFATGLRAPNGTGMGPAGEVSCSDNQGIWTPVDRLNLIKKGGFYGCVGTSHRAAPPTTYDPPLCWLPYPNPDNSGGGQAWVPDDRWGPFNGSMLYLSYGKSSLFHVLMEDVGGVMQGAVVKMPLKFDAGIMRARFNPADGQLYVAGLRGWQTDAARDGCLQRVRYTSKAVYDVKSMHVRKGFVDLSFTQPLDAASATDVQNYDVQWWNYRWTAKYGSAEYRVSDAKKTGRDTLAVQGVKLSADAKTLSLEMDGLDQAVMSLAIKLKIDAADKTPIALEIDGTVNRLP